MRTLDQIDLSDNDLAAVRQAASILRRRFPVTTVVLFGSTVGHYIVKADEFVAQMKRLLHV